MCYRVATPSKVSDIEQEFLASMELPETFQSYEHLNGFSGKSVPIISWENPKIISMVPWQSHNEFNTLNAKSEEIFHPKKYFKKFNHRRAILPVKGFYESIEIKKPNRKTGDKFPYFIFLEDKKCFGLACLISHFNTVSILTTSANAIMEEIHNNARRMPVILHREDYLKWLSEDLEQEEMSLMMRPYEENEMSAFPISKLLYSKTEDTNVAHVNSKFRYAEVALPVYKKGEKILENPPSLFD